MTSRTIVRFGLLGCLLAVAAFATGCGKSQLAGPGTDGIEEVTASDFQASAIRFGIANHLNRVDRMGMPAIGTVVISSKDAYNAADPTDDAAGTFVGEIVANVQALHDALDDDLTGAGLTPCETGDCVGQAAPFVVPDVITIDPSQPAGFPNGRTLTDPVIDVTLALVLLDLNVHGVTTLVGLNPTQNDRPFMGSFPYLANRHPAKGVGRL